MCVFVCQTKLYHLPSAHALAAYELLVAHVHSHYKVASLLHLGGAIRLQVSQASDTDIWQGCKLWPGKKGRYLNFG